jgi:hypothetical protein
MERPHGDAGSHRIHHHKAMGGNVMSYAGWYNSPRTSGVRASIRTQARNGRFPGIDKGGFWLAMAMTQMI